MKPTKHILLLATLLLGSLAASAEDFEVDGIYYNITSETDLTVEVTYRGTNSNSYPDEYTGEVAIPGTATYNGNTYSVTSVGSSAFYGCKNLTAVTIPEGVTSIGGSAFYGCSGLATITVSETVSTIGSNAFSNCSVLTHIAIPSSVTSVGNFCFSGCIRLDSVVFEDGDETLLLGNCKYSDGVGGGLFEGLRINEVYVGRNLKFSDHNDSYNRPYYTALFACWNANSYPIVSTVTIGPRVTELPDYMFQDCKDLTFIICMAEEVPVCYSSSFKTIRKEKGLDLDRCMLFVPAESVEAYKAVAYWSEFANIRPISTNDVDSGTCGENLTWTLYADGELIIEGTGKMGSYTSSTMPWYCYRAMIKSVTVKEGVTSVGQSAFSGCIRLTSATLHESVTSIGNNAFSGCTDLTSVTLPEGVTSIGGYAFSACSSLASITIPESVASIGENAFSNGYLTAVHISNLESWCMITFGNYASNPLANAHDLYLNGELVTELVVPEGVASIGRMAFYKCSSLTSITIPESVTSIGNNAFYNCSGITAITCKAVTPPAIGNSYTFDGVDKSILIYVPAESVEAYKAAAYWSEFTNYQPLSSDIASGTCGDNLTWRLTEEYELVIEGTGEMYDYTHNYGTQTPWEEYRSSIKEVTIFEGVTSIGEHAFYDCDGLTSITIPENSQLTSIGNGAFEDCSSLTAITIPEGVTSIGECTFSGCSSLTSITILEGVTSIGRQAFCACNLISIYIPASVTSIGKGAFANNPNLAEIVVNQGNSYYDSRNSCNAIIEKANGQLVAGCTSTLIPEGVTTIGYGAFCVSNLSSIDIPKSVTSIGDYAFNYCSSLTAITLPEGVTSIGEWAFDGCSSLTTITCNAATPPTIYPSTFLGVDKSIPVYVPAGSVEAYKAAAYWSEFTNYQPLSSDIASGTCGDNLTWKLTEEYELVIEGMGDMYDYTSGSQPWYEYRESIQTITLSEGVTSIGEYAFEECSGLALIYIPNGIRRIGECAFLNCDGLTTVHISSMEAWCNIDFDGYFATPLYYARNLYLNGDLVTEVNIPNTLESVKDYTFYNCSALASVTIPEGITEIGSYAFYYCRSLTSVIVPEGVTVLESYTFQYCSSLESLSLPNSLQKISWSAISHCDALKTIILPKNVHAIESYAFDYTGLTSVIIPEGVSKISYATFSHCSSLASISIPSSVSLIEELSLECCESLASITCHAVIPPAIGASNTFDGVDKSIPVYVPAGSVQAYKAAEYWSEFTNIQAISSDVASGTCGDNLTWRLTEEYELIIEGTGEMYDGSSWEGYEEAVKSITIGEGVTSIGDICFWNFSNLEVLTIPGSLTKIGGNPFYGCTELYTILLKSENPVYDIYDGNVVEKNSGTVVIGCRHVPAYSNVTKVGDFAYCGRGLSSIVIPESITSIGYAAFSENEDMTSITIPESVTSIGDHAFANCQKLTSVNIPEGVTKIGDWTFLQCYSLTSIEIPSSVTELGNLAFGLCESVTSITCMATNPPAAGNSFQGIDKSIPVYVPAGSVAAYKVANDWSEFTNILPIGEPEPATVTITINQYGSGTYSSEYALDFSEVMLLKAYVATGYNHLTGEVTLLRVHTAEAGTGLLVKGIPGMSYKVPVLESTADHTLNMLVATLEKTKVNGHSDDGVYANYKYTVVKEQSSEPLFYQFADGASLSAGKAYLQIPVAWLPATGQRALRYRFDEGETTDIEETTANGGQSMVIYDLMGRRVLSPKKGEIYIINNKKVVY